MNVDAYPHDLPFEVDNGLGEQAKIGLIVLQTDQTIEHELAFTLRRDAVAVYHVRIPNAMDVTPETLKKMEADMPIAAALLPEKFDFDVIGYCCTSGATMIGESRVDAILRKVHPNAFTSNPLTACKAALRALELQRIAIVTPYSVSVTSRLCEDLRASGINVNAVASFNQSDDFKVARITSRSIQNAIEQIGARDDCDGVFVSCTSLRTLPVISAAEAQLGKPVLSSNQVIAWHMMRLVGIDGGPENCGKLFRHSLNLSELT